MQPENILLGSILLIIGIIGLFYCVPKNKQKGTINKRDYLFGGIIAFCACTFIVWIFTVKLQKYFQQVNRKNRAIQRAYNQDLQVLSKPL